MVDVFNEVDEQIREERFRALMRRIVPLFIAALVIAVIAVLGVWGYRQYSLGGIGKASDAYAKGLDLMQQNDLNGSFAQFDIAAKGPPGYRSLALMQEAAIRVAQNRTSDAVALFDQAAKAAPDKMMADAASLKAAYLLLDTASL
ncbi:MAG TPA: tetratricopeptide repeat protein, partial [Caulobacteraceae bacterium]|nr:tetratricopeptide repeat protein [Caulobacteraceae bacterium]